MGAVRVLAGVSCDQQGRKPILKHSVLIRAWVKQQKANHSLKEEGKFVVETPK